MDILETEIIKSADYAVKLALEKFGVTLDFSIISLKELDTLLQRAHQYFQNSIRSGKPVEDAVRKNSRLWGIYFGEVVRRELGGIWVQRGNDLVLATNGIEIIPFNLVSLRLKSTTYLSIGKAFEEIMVWIEGEQKKVSEKALFESINPVPPSMPVNVTEKGSIQSDQPQTNFWKQNAPILTAVGIVLVAIVVVLIIGLSNQVPAKFKTDLDAFIDEGQKLSIMTSQGVNATDFQNQLTEVKLAYSRLEESWPDSYASARQNFNKAMFGWNYANDFWQNKLDDAPRYDDEDFAKFSDYLNSNPFGFSPTIYSSYTPSLLVDALIIDFFTLASLYFEEGKTEAGY